MTCSVIELKSKSNMNTMDKEQKECLKNQQEINIGMNNLTVSELEIPHNPLYSIKILDSDRTKQVGIPLVQLVIKMVSWK